MKTTNNTQKIEQLSNEQLNSVKAKFATESTSFGACVRNFYEVAKSDATAKVMLQTIVGYTDKGKETVKEGKINEIKKAVKAAYPFTKNGVMLKKDGELFVPVETFGFNIIKAAYLAKIGAKKRPAEIVQATDEQVEEYEAKKAEKRDAKAQVRRLEKEQQAEQLDLLEALINANSADAAWALILAEREERASKDTEVK